MTNHFHQRCKLALTHPVTLGAVALLLVNDWLLKPVWSSDWTTGKISDFAWMAFFPPLLAFPLSLVARGNERAQRAAFLAAYAALPLLYAAYNTIEPLHDWIMSGFMLLSGASAGSPLDPWDSLVIPPAMALALWVWRHSAHAREGVRTRLHLYAVVIAALATVATSVNEVHGDSRLGVSENGVVVFHGAKSTLYSYDGGLNWGGPGDKPGPMVSIVWGTQSVATPRGTYSLNGPAIYKTGHDGVSHEVHSLRYLGEERNRWAQAAMTKKQRRSLSQIHSQRQEMIITEPLNIVFDEQTGNVIASLGILGVAVGNPNEHWSAVAVSTDYKPPDLSFLGRARWLFTPDYWFAAVAVPLSFIAGAIGFVAGGPGTAHRPSVVNRPTSGNNLPLVFLPVVLAPVPLYFISSVLPSQAREMVTVVVGPMISLTLLVAFALVVAAPFLLLTGVRGQPPHSHTRRGNSLLFSICGLILSVAFLEPYEIESALLSSFENLFWIAGVVAAVIAFSVYLPNRTQLPVVAAAFVAMNILLPLPFLLWLAGGLTLWLATLGAAALLTLTAYALYRHLIRQAESPPAAT